LSEKTSVGGNVPLLASRKVVAFLIAISLISIGVISYAVLSTSAIEGKSLPVVEYGDLAYVEYVGMFTDNPGGWVFDTNKRSVGTDGSIVKSLFFWDRDPDQYKPLNFTAGISENYLKPFVDGVVGMSVHQTKRVYIPLEDAYSLVDENILDLPLVMDVPVIQNLTYSEFYGAYKINPYVGIMVKHVFWEWGATVIDMIGDKIFLQSNPVVGQIVSSFGNPEKDLRDGWYQEVLSINSSANNGEGIIKVLNKISPQDVYQRKGTNYDGSPFTLIDVAADVNRFTVIYNTETYIGELAGRALIFDITVTAVNKV
jgi:FKBP-type peptidyl-prolyl cis-trans isomerase 2